MWSMGSPAAKSMVVVMRSRVMLSGSTCEVIWSVLWFGLVWFGVECL